MQCPRWLGVTGPLRSCRLLYQPQVRLPPSLWGAIGAIPGHTSPPTCYSFQDTTVYKSGIITMGISPHTKNRTQFLFLKTTIDYWEWEKGQAEPISLTYSMVCSRSGRCHVNKSACVCVCVCLCVCVCCFCSRFQGKRKIFLLSLWDGRMRN